MKSSYGSTSGSVSPAHILRILEKFPFTWGDWRRSVAAAAEIHPMRTRRKSFSPHIPHQQSSVSCHCIFCVFRAQLCRVPRHIQREAYATNPYTTDIADIIRRQTNHKDCCGTHCSQTQKYPSNWRPTSHLNKNILSYKSYLIQFEETECHTRCADIIKIQEVWRKHDACEEKIAIQKKICEKEAYAVPEKGMKQQSRGSPVRHERDKWGKELRTQLRI